VYHIRGLRRQFCRVITFTSALLALACVPVGSQAKPQELTARPERFESHLSRGARSSGQKHPDKVLKTLRLKGSFSKFEVGDYTHVVIKKNDGKETSFWLGSNGEVLMKFLVAHKGKPLSLTYQVVKSYIPEAGGYQTIERLIDARSDGETAAQWWRRIKADPAARKKIEQETEKLLGSANQ
jgi:hypothetical protein